MASVETGCEQGRRGAGDPGTDREHAPTLDKLPAIIPRAGAGPVSRGGQGAPGRLQWFIEEARPVAPRPPGLTAETVAASEK
jgi:hypothetical protein